MEKETLEEIYDVMVERLGSILKSKAEYTARSKDSYITDAVKEYIYKNYHSKALSLEKISTFMNISARRLSRVFKEETQMSVADYISEVRLERVAELFDNSAFNVNEVIAKIGLENETYFYRIFKKKFGLTPKEYAFKRIVKMTQE